MAKIYGNPITLGGGGGQNADLPPLLDNFKAVTGEGENTILVSANKMEVSRANELAGAVWVYADHEPDSVNDGTKIQLSRDDVVDFGSAETASTLYTRDTTESQPITELASGSKIKLGKWNGTDLQWKVARDGITGDLRLLLEPTSVNVLGKRAYDAAEPSNGDTNRRISGNNRYSYSNIHQWLNSEKDAGEWFTATHTADVAPSYSSDPGFLNGWESLHIQVLNNTVWKTSKANVDGGGVEDVIGRVELVSITELGDTTSGYDDGNKLDIINGTSDVNVGSDCWTRTPVVSSSYMAWYSSPLGYLGNNDIKCSGSYSIRTICAPSNRTLVSPEVDIDGCYTIVGITPDYSQVTRTVQWDSTKNFFARQFTYNSKKQYQTMLEGAVAYPPIMPDGQELSKLPSKSKVKLGKFNGIPLKWLVCRDSVDQSLRLVLDGESVGVIGNKMFDNKEPNNSDSERMNYGNDRYIWSNIHQWLNSSNPANGWYSSQHSADAAPDYTNVAGFLYEWTEKEISVLENASWVVTKNSVDGGGTESFQGRIVLPSTTEIGLESGTGGSKLDIFNSNSDRVVTGEYYWCRTPYPPLPGVARMVYTNGTITQRKACYTDFGVRPLCKPIQTILVSAQPDSDGCYTLV